MKHADVIFLIGFSGSGKSTIGPLLAKKFGSKFYDTDNLIEKEQGMSIAELFAKRGEASFRKAERAMIARVVENDSGSKVISLGGGAFERKANRDLIQGNGVTVYLSCSVRQLYGRLKDKVDRPLLNVVPVPGQTKREAVLKRIAMLLEKRAGNYRKADLTVSTSERTAGEVVRAIVDGVRQASEKS